MVPGLVPIRTCSLSNINEISYANSRRILKALDGTRSRKLEFALRQNKTLTDFVKQMCPQTSDIMTWIHLSEENSGRDSKLVTQYREEENASILAANASPTPALEPQINYADRALAREPVAIAPPAPVAVVTLPPPVTTVAVQPVVATLAPANPVPATVGPRPEIIVAHPENEPLHNPAVRELVLSSAEPRQNFNPRSTQPVIDTPPRRSSTTDATRGWVYLGAQVNGAWSGRHFDWPGELPESGVVLDVTGSVNIRDDYIRYSRETGLGSPEIIGAVQPGQQIIASQIVEASPGYYWAEIQ